MYLALRFAVALHRTVTGPVIKILVAGNPGASLCRYSPTCSAYLLEAVRRHGWLRGWAMAIRRLLRCHPWGGCGWDPVPLPRSGSAPRAAQISRIPKS